MKYTTLPAIRFCRHASVDYSKIRVMYLVWLGIVLLIVLCGCPQEQSIGIGDNLDFGVTQAAISPVITEVVPKSAVSVDITFSEPVTVEDVTASEELGTTEAATEENVVHVTFSKAMTPGDRYEITGAVSNSADSTLNFAVPFTGYNDRIPDLTINEVRSKYVKGKSEFVELYAATDGNLAGVAVVCATSGREKAFIFPQVEVAAKSYIVVHLRKPEDVVTNDDLDGPTSGSGEEASDCGYDFWLDNTESILSETDVVLLQATTGGNIIDALVMCDGKKTTWGNNDVEAAVTMAVSAGKWGPNNSIESAVRTSDNAGKNGVTTTRSLSKKSVTAPTATASSWCITKTSGNTPGADNMLSE